MTEYKIYLLDKDNQITDAPEVLSCDSDEAAIIQVKQQLAHAYDIEIWEGRRLVATLKPTT
jgi:hypothetical protein